MTPNQIIGIGMIVALFVALFVWGGLIAGWRIVAESFLLTFFLATFIYVAVWFVSNP